MLTFTKAFKEEFIAAYNKGQVPRDILEAHSFDLSVLGERRIWSISEHIRAEYKMHGYSKGAHGIYMALIHMEPSVIMNLKKIRRLMEKYHLVCPLRGSNPYRRMAKALKTSNVAANILQR